MIIQKVDSNTAHVLALQKGDADIAVVPDRDTLVKLRGVPGVTVYDSLPVRDLATVMLFNQNVEDPALLPPGQLAENNMPSNFLSDAHVRRAFAAAFNLPVFTRDALQGNGLTMNTTLPPNSWANDLSIKRPAYSLASTQTEFKQAFGGKLWSTGFTIPMIYVAGQGISEVISGILKQNIEAINPKFHVNVSTIELSAGNAALFQGKLSAVALTWGGPDPDTVLRGLYSSTGILAPAANIQDPKLESQLNQVNTAVGQRASRYTAPCCSI